MGKVPRTKRDLPQKCQGPSPAPSETFPSPPEAFPQENSGVGGGDGAAAEQVGGDQAVGLDLLMSCALAQRFDPATPMIHRFFVGFGITDEIFGITIARPGTIQPVYNYGAILFAAILWALGTSMGIIAGNFLPARVVSALSVALYGMFLAIIIPPARKNLVIAIAVAVSFLCSWVCGIIPYVKELSAGTRTIILTVVIASIVAIIKPIEEDPSTSSGTPEAAGVGEPVEPPQDGGTL